MSRKPKRLNGRQQLFVGYYCEGPTKGNITQSMVKAGYTYKYADKQGTSQLGKIGISKAITARKAVIADKEEITIEVLDRNFADVYQECRAHNDRVNALRCMENQSKHVGYYEQDNRQRGSELPKLTAEEEAIIRSNAIKLTNRRIA